MREPLQTVKRQVSFRDSARGGRLACVACNDPVELGSGGERQTCVQVVILLFFLATYEQGLTQDGRKPLDGMNTCLVLL